MNTDRTIAYMPSSVRLEKYSTRTVKEGQEWLSSWYATKEEAVSEQLIREKAIKEKYDSHKDEAMDKLNEIERSINKILGENKASLDFDYEGDSHGIYDERLTLSIVVGGFEYTKGVEF